MKTIYHLAISRLKYNKGRSILTIVAIALMTTLLMSIGSSALTVIRHQQLEIKESARNYHAAFKGSTADQVFILENHADVESLSTRESVASIELPKLNAVLNFDSTKKGSIGPARFSYNHTSKLTRRPRYSDRSINLMDSRERVQFGKELSDLHYQFPSNMPKVGYEGALYRYYSGLTDYAGFKQEVLRYETVNTDWFDILTQDAYSHDHTFGVSGGSESMRYYVSLGANFEDGVSKTTKTERYTAMVNLDINFSPKIRANFSLNGNIQRKNHLMPDIDAMDYAYNTSRAIPCYDEDGSLFYYDAIGYGGSNVSHKQFRYNILNEISE